MEILINFRMKIPGIKNQEIKHNLKTILKDLGHNKSELSILFTDNEQISVLNEKYLGRIGPTDVISFPMCDSPDSTVPSPMLGDVVISVETAIKQAEEYEEPLSDAIYRLLIHGILHLVGYDHEKSDDDAELMEKEEIRIMKIIKGYI